MSTPAERNQAAELRAVEEGHRARLMYLSTADGTRPVIVVKSDSEPGKEYHVRAIASPGGPLVFSCQPSEDRRHAAQADHGPIERSEPGIVPCKHAAVAVRRLERAKLARMNYTTGCWEDARQAPPRPPDADVFAGLNR